MPRKTFRRAVGAEPIEFDLEGEKTTQNFKCRSSMSAGVMLKFTESFTEEDIEEATASGTGKTLTATEQAEANKKGAEVIPLLKEFFDAALQKEATARFWAMIYDPDEAIDLPMLMDLTGWLTEAFSGERPTSGNSSSTSEASSPGAGSPAGQAPSDVPTPIYSRPELTSSST